MITNSTTASAIHQKSSASAKQHTAESELTATSAKLQRSTALQGARDAVWVADVGYNCIRDHITPIMVALEALTHTNAITAKDLIRRIDVIRELAKVGVLAVANMENTMDCEHEEMRNKLNVLEGALS